MIGVVPQRSPMKANSALQCDTIAVGNDGVGVRDVRMNGRSGYICAGCKFLPKTGKLATDIAQATDFIHVKVLNNLIEAQPPGVAIVFLSFFAWKCRETAVYLSYLTDFI